jgi:hypothetical protein
MCCHTPDRYSPVTSHAIRDSVTRQMGVVFSFHMRITFLLMGAQLWLGRLTSPCGIALALALFVNSLCMAERFWDLQLHSLVFWPPASQCVFLVSRLLLVTIAIICTLLWAKIGWRVVMEEWVVGE